MSVGQFSIYQDLARLERGSRSDFGPISLEIQYNLSDLEAIIYKNVGYKSVISAIVTLIPKLSLLGNSEKLNGPRKWEIILLGFFGMNKIARFGRHLLSGSQSWPQTIAILGPGIKHEAGSFFQDVKPHIFSLGLGTMAITSNWHTLLMFYPRRDFSELWLSWQTTYLGRMVIFYIK